MTIPFFKVPKDGWRSIEQTFELGTAASAKLVYASLCRISNDKRSTTFTVPIAYVATVASLNRRTVERRLEDLERLRLVGVERHRLRTSHTYTLTTLSRNDTTQSRNDTTVRGPFTVALSKNSKKSTNGKPGDTPTEGTLPDLRKGYQEELRRLEDAP